jgi:hypothetical protein
MNETPKRRGRPQGSTSFVKVNLNHLVSQLGKETAITVSKKWLDNLANLGLWSEPSNNPVKITAMPTPIALEEPEAKIQFSINRFND